MKRVAYLDGWRGCAVLAVLAGHFLTTKGINLGRVGVELFFVLSGRLMAEILFVRQTPLPTFYFRRFSRVYPTLLILAVTMLATSFLRKGDPTFGQFVGAATLTANYLQFWVGRSEVLDHVWSLCVEEHMYLLLGLVAWAHRSFRLPAFWICCVLAAGAMINGAVQTAMGGDYYSVYWRSDVRGASILVGAIAYLLLHEKRPAILSWPGTPILLGAMALLLNIKIVPDTLKYSIGTMLLAISLVLMPHAPPKFLKLLEHPLLLRTGVISYSLYLWQQPMHKLGGPLPHRLMHLAMAFILAWFSYRFIETPTRAFLNNRLGGRQSTVLG